MTDRLETTFLAHLDDIKHKRPEAAGGAPGTRLTVDAGALEAEVAAKLFRLNNGHPVQITIAEVQERMPMEEPKPAVPGSFHSMKPEQLDPDAPDR